MRRTLALAVAVPLLLACEGSEGPAGPQGPPGPQGPEGPPGPAAQLHMQTTTVASDGSAAVSFSGLQLETSVVNCWISDTQEGPWLHVGTDTSGPTCGAFNDGADLVVAILDAPSGWIFMATVATEP